MPRVSANPKPRGPGILSRMWMGLAHGAGATFRIFMTNTVSPDERRDGLPFALIVFAIVGAQIADLLPPIMELCRRTITA